MFVIAGALLGILMGIRAARKRGGSVLDQVQYAAGFGIAFALVGMVITVAVERLFV